MFMAEGKGVLELGGVAHPPMATFARIYSGLFGTHTPLWLNTLT